VYSNLLREGVITMVNKHGIRIMDKDEDVFGLKCGDDRQTYKPQDERLKNITRYPVLRMALEKAGK